MKNPPRRRAADTAPDTDIDAAPGASAIDADAAGAQNHAALGDALPAALLPWYDRHHRVLPWRETRDPYAIWLSETMLQQTQVATVLPYYHKFLERFPTLAALASAPLDDVLKCWSGLGYYRRARHLHAAARAMLEHHGGQVPGTAAALMTLPGIGRYTAGAVASFAFGEAAPIVDCNVARVFCRLFNIHGDISIPATQKQLWTIAEELVPAGRPGAFNHALMELGATICVPDAPDCPRCPARQLCQAATAGTQQIVPIKKGKPKRKMIRQFALVLQCGDKQLLLQRPEKCVWEGLWEFPCVPYLPQFNSPKRLADTFSERTGLAVALERKCGTISWQLTHRTMRYTIYRGLVLGGMERFRLPVCDRGRYQKWQWLTSLADVPVGAVTRKIALLARSG